MVYAEAANLAEYLGIDVSALPTDYARLLARASESVDYATANGLDMTNPDHVDAATKATCAQVEYWMSNAEGTELDGAIKSRTIGKTSVTYATGAEGSGTPDLAPRARRILWLAGLIYQGASLA